MSTRINLYLKTCLNISVFLMGRVAKGVDVKYTVTVVTILLLIATVNSVSTELFPMIRHEDGETHLIVKLVRANESMTYEDYLINPYSRYIPIPSMNITVSIINSSGEYPVPGCAPGITNASGEVDCVVPVDRPDVASIRIRFDGYGDYEPSEKLIRLPHTQLVLVNAKNLGDILNDVFQNPNIVPACVGVLIILGLLFAAMFYSGDNPFAVFDITSPKLPGPLPKADMGSRIELPSAAGLIKSRKKVRKALKALRAVGIGTVLKNAYKQAYKTARSGRERSLIERIKRSGLSPVAKIYMLKLLFAKRYKDVVMILEGKRKLPSSEVLADMVSDKKLDELIIESRGKSYRQLLDLLNRKTNAYIVSKAEYEEALSKYREMTRGLPRWVRMVEKVPLIGTMVMHSSYVKMHIARKEAIESAKEFGRRAAHAPSTLAVALERPMKMPPAYIEEAIKELSNPTEVVNDYYRRTADVAASFLIRHVRDETAKKFVEHRLRTILADPTTNEFEKAEEVLKLMESKTVLETLSPTQKKTVNLVRTALTNSLHNVRNIETSETNPLAAYVKVNEYMNRQTQEWNWMFEHTVPKGTSTAKVNRMVKEAEKEGLEIDREMFASLITLGTRMRREIQQVLFDSADVFQPLPDPYEYLYIKTNASQIAKETFESTGKPYEEALKEIEKEIKRMEQQIKINRPHMVRTITDVEIANRLRAGGTVNIDLIRKDVEERFKRWTAKDEVLEKYYTTLQNTYRHSYQAHESEVNGAVNIIKAYYNALEKTGLNNMPVEGDKSLSEIFEEIKEKTKDEREAYLRFGAMYSEHADELFEEHFEDRMLTEELMTKKPGKIRSAPKVKDVLSELPYYLSMSGERILVNPDEQIPPKLVFRPERLTPKYKLTLLSPKDRTVRLIPGERLDYSKAIGHAARYRYLGEVWLDERDISKIIHMLRKGIISMSEIE